MKKLLFIALTGLALFIGRTEAGDRWNNGNSPVNFFFSSLSPHGEWIEIDNDLYAWHPNGVSGRWMPYSEGRWIWSDYGWYWDSYEPFGWAVYHYGRWYNDEYYGWIWIPDDKWGPAWVEWRNNNDYVGWAPLPPYAVFTVGIGIHFTRDWHFPARFWNYVHCNNFYDYDIAPSLVNDRMKISIHPGTKYRDNYDYRDGRVINRGIDRDFIEKRGGRSIVQRNISETKLRDFEGSRGSANRDRNKIEVFRPNSQELNKSGDISKTDIKRPGRKTSLDLSRIGRPAPADRTPDVSPDKPREGNDRNKGVNRNNEGNNKPAEIIMAPRGSNNRQNRGTPQVRENRTDNPVRNVERKRSEAGKSESRGRGGSRNDDRPDENTRERER
ncbi:MAG: DUF6600 domain-containing protein [Ignavibacteria bacterium]